MAMPLTKQEQEIIDPIGTPGGAGPLPTEGQVPTEPTPGELPPETSPAPAPPTPPMPPAAGGTGATPLAPGSFALPGEGGQTAPYRTANFFRNRFVGGSGEADRRLGALPRNTAPDAPLGLGTGGEMGDRPVDEDEMSRIFASVLGMR